MKYILIADDSDIIRSIVEQTLLLNNYKQILKAIDGADALQKAKEHLGKIALYVLM